MKVALEQPSPRTRPRNRRDLILAAAGDLLVMRGYANVSMSDIAGAVSIGASALYRHFSSKEDLLYETVHQPFAAITRSVSPRNVDTFGDAARLLAEWVLDNRGLGVLWQRESRHLPPARRDQLRSEIVAVQQLLVDALSGERAGLSPAQADLLTWGVMDTLMSVSFQSIQLAHDEYLALLVHIAGDVVRVPLPVAGAEVPAGDHEISVAGNGSTVDRLVAAATRLFAERSYQSVGIDEVAAHAGIAGPSIYHHFDGKIDLLTAVMGDVADRLIASQHRILRTDGSAQQKLDQLLRSYIDFAFANSNVLDVLIAETDNLAAESQARIRAQQQSYVSEWVKLLEAMNPNLRSGHARVRVQAALTLANDIARTAHLRQQAGTRAAVAAIGSAILH